MFEFDNKEDSRDERSELDELMEPQREKPFTLMQIAVFVLTILFVGLASYAVSQHSTAKQLAGQNSAIEKSLKDTTAQVAALTAKLNAMPDSQAVQSKQEGLSTEEASAAAAPTKPRAIRASSSASKAKSGKHRSKADTVAENRIRKMQSQLDEQGRAIESTRKDIASTRGDLASTRTELNGSIARTHEEVVALQRRGERNIREFEILKAKVFQDQGALSLRLKKANVKKQYADIEVIVDDRKVSKNHVNLYEPTSFFMPDSEQPVQVVINQITKDRIHGYVAAPKYRSSELTAMQNNAQATTYQSQAGNSPSASQSGPAPIGSGSAYAQPSSQPRQRLQ